MEIVQATAAGRIYAFRGDGAVLPGFPVATHTARNVRPHLARGLRLAGPSRRRRR